MKFIIAGIVATILTGISYIVGIKFDWISELNLLEIFSVWTSYACTYLCVVQSRWNYPIGAISVIALSVLFYQQSLFASMALNIYLIPTLIWGWFRWRPDDNTRPVTNVAVYWWPIYIGLTAIVWYSLTEIAKYLGSPLAGPDSLILSTSILAQFLLDQKKIETWIVWFIVNVISIYTYWQAGLVLVAFQYIFFLMNTFWGYVEWRNTKNEMMKGVYYA